MSDSRPAAQTHERRLSVLAQLVLLGALRDVLARLERARLAASPTINKASGAFCMTPYMPKNEDMMNQVLLC